MIFFAAHFFFSRYGRSEEKVNSNSCCRIASFQFHFVLFYKCGSVSGWQREQKSIHLSTFCRKKSGETVGAGEREYVRVRLSIYLSGDSSMIAFVLQGRFAQSSIYGILCSIASIPFKHLLLWPISISLSRSLCVCVNTRYYYSVLYLNKRSQVLLLLIVVSKLNWIFNEVCPHFDLSKFEYNHSKCRKKCECKARIKCVTSPRVISMACRHTVSNGNTLKCQTSVHSLIKCCVTKCWVYKCTLKFINLHELLKSWVKAPSFFFIKIASRTELLINSCRKTSQFRHTCWFFQILFSQRKKCSVLARRYISHDMDKKPLCSDRNRSLNFYVDFYSSSAF